MLFAVLQRSCTIMIMPWVVISCADWSFTLTRCFQSWKSPASFLLLHAVGLQLKRHWHVNTAGRFFLASRQGLGSSLITQCSSLFRSSCLLVLFLKISHSIFFLLPVTGLFELLWFRPFAQHNLFIVLSVYWQSVFACSDARPPSLLCETIKSGPFLFAGWLNPPVTRGINRRSIRSNLANDVKHRCGKRL